MHCVTGLANRRPVARPTIATSLKPGHGFIVGVAHLVRHPRVLPALVAAEVDRANAP